MTLYYSRSKLRVYAKKSGLASEALSRVQKQLEQNSQFLQIPYKNSVIHTLIFYWHFLTQITELLPQFWP